LVVLVFLGVWNVALGHWFEIFPFNTCTHSYKLSSQDCLWCVPSVQKVTFSFSLTSRNLLISYFISSITHWSLSNVLFSFQLFACFFTIVFVLSSNFNALWSDRMHGIISAFLYFKDCFVP
jgi:hypothetical protein